MTKAMKRTFAAALVIVLCISGCDAFSKRQFSVTYLDLFDTVTTITAAVSSQQDFQTQAQQIYKQLQQYHRLFDIYQEYPGINNLKTVNDNAGIAPVEVDEKIISFLKDCRDYYDLTQGAMHVAMGSVLQLWHQCRQSALEDPKLAALPQMAALQEALQHIDMNDLVLDEEKSTVYLADKAMALDVGAVAKGWAARQVAEDLPEGFLLSIGGSIYATGPKGENTPWIIGIEDPDGGAYLHKLSLTEGGVATSGDYQRYFTVDGVNYHHIIDPQTAVPTALWRSVSVVCPDPGLADVLSTALFVLPLEEGKELAAKAQAEAMWLDHTGQRYYTEGFENYIA